MKKLPAIGAILLTCTLALGACSGQSKDSQSASPSPSASASATQSASSSEETPQVDRSGQGNFPEVSGDFGQKPEIKAGSGSVGDAILVKTLHKGDGATVGLDDIVQVNYAGVLFSDAKVFDSSFQDGRTPIAFSLNQVIKGWKYGLADAHIGDRVELVIPSKWGYGAQGSGSSIPANADLVFVVDILGTVNPNDTSQLTSATPTGNELPAGITVSGDLGSQPTITWGQSAPTETSKVVIAEGHGDKVAVGSTILYQGVGTVFGNDARTQSTWGQQGAQVVSVKDGNQLIGFTAGSRVLLVAAGNEAQGQSPQAIVVDILAVIPQK